MIEYDTFTRDAFHDIVSINFNAKNVSIESLLNKWSNNKLDLYKLFNNNLMIFSDLFEISIEDENIITDNFSKFKHSLWKFIEEPEIAELFKDFLHEAVSFTGFINNKVQKEWTGYINKTFTIPEGMKLAKAFKFFFNSSNQEKLIDLQNFYSTFTQHYKSRKKGKIVLSIHPLDFLSISANNNGWDSCHNLVHGDYRAGNFNYLIDSSTIVAYYISEDDNNNEEIPGFGKNKWNSKIWRMLIHLRQEKDKVAIIYNRQYPFQSDQLFKVVDKLLLNLFETIPFNDIQDIGYIFEFGVHLTNYNNNFCYHTDIDEGNHIFFRTTFGHDVEEFRRFIPIGEDFLCLSCGEEYGFYGENGYCEYCDKGVYKCEVSGKKCFDEDCLYVNYYDDPLCNDYLDNHCTICDCCGTYIHHKEVKHVKNEEGVLCPSCFSRYNTNKE